MEIVKKKIYAVLTGDIVGSSKLPSASRQSLQQVLHNVSENISLYFHDIVPYKMDVFRGDSWQFVVSEPSKSLRIGLFLRSLIREGVEGMRVDTRISIALGTISFIPQSNVSGGDGEAFRLSGESLEEMNKAFRMKIAFPERLQSDLTSALDVIVKLIDYQVSEWTQQQAKAVSGAILGFTQTQIADGWFEKNITQQAIAQHLDRAGWSTLELGINFFEFVLPKLII